MVKTSEVKASITVGVISKTVALILTLLGNLYSADAKRIIKTVAAHYDMVVQ